MVEYKPEPTYRISFMFRKILVPIDGSENSFRALEIALDFAKRYGSKVTVLYVDEGSTDTLLLAEKVKARAKETGITVDFKIKKYSPSISSVENEILQEIVEGGYDLVIVGARGNTVNEEMLIGSKVLSIVVNAPVSIMIVR